MNFDWQTHPEAEALIDRLVAEATAVSPAVAQLAGRLTTDTATRLVDWLDHISWPVETGELAAAGFIDGWNSVAGVWRHPGAQLPAVVPARDRGLALRVDDALAAREMLGGKAAVEGSPLSGFCRVLLDADAVRVFAVERRSWAAGVQPKLWERRDELKATAAWNLWAARNRHEDPMFGVTQAVDVASAMVALVPPGLAASYVLEQERRFWQRRNTAAAAQHARQDRLGLGWGNHDHHTFRSSRKSFQELIQVFTTLGFRRREKFYAGAEAGWGAQVLEHPDSGGVIFADVDLGPEEIQVDFAGEQLGTIGLWCALHGESVLSAGMHHLEGQFEFDALRETLPGGHMRPFSDFPHLRQAFTEAEIWPVPAERLDKLVADGVLDRETADRMARDGAAGSHLENLARRGGFKGFNQENVSSTIAATDPRSYRPV
ncbi:hypothetical protein D5S17_30025 [Pseudonocardiaceae bacterium YIM PH 21723]|nr:hypothetical protein D5S17_30025 [Pseudonocardiaceae bacterium YIM PH 21723]